MKRKRRKEIVKIKYQFLTSKISILEIWLGSENVSTSPKWMLQTNQAKKQSFFNSALSKVIFFIWE